MEAVPSGSEFQCTEKIFGCILVSQIKKIHMSINMVLGHKQQYYFFGENDVLNHESYSSLYPR